MIHIERPFIKTDAEYATLTAYITIDDNRQPVWFKVEKKYSSYLCDERGDAFLILVLNYAMRHGHDIVSEAPIGEYLYYNIDRYLIDALADYNPHFRRTRINAPVDSSSLSCARAVGTGISCGVDSMYVLAEELKDKFPLHKLTHVMFNNVGSHGEGVHGRQLFQSKKQRPQEIANNLNLELIFGDSNAMDVVVQNHFFTHTYSSMFAVFCLQKLFSVYYYASSASKYHEFSLVDDGKRGSGSYEFLSLRCFTTDKLTILSQGESKSRLEKLRTVVKYHPAYQYIHVCLKADNNCGKCEKCVRTLLGIDALGELDNFKESFDIDYYRKNRSWYIQQMMYHRADGKHDYLDLYDALKKDVTFSMRFKTILYRLQSVLKDAIRPHKGLYRYLKSLYESHNNG